MMNNMAMITGASEGLGKSLALECAKRNMDLFLVSLPDSGLPSLCNFIEQNFHVAVKFYEVDLTIESNCKDVCNFVINNALPINILINNAGVGGNFHFEKQDFHLFSKMIHLNILATTLITHEMIPVMSKMENAHILNVSSMAIFFDAPFKQVYGATKSFTYYFSKSLSFELKSKNISVSVVCPGGINSNPRMTRANNKCNMLTKFSVMSPELVAKQAIEGMLNHKKVIIPGRVVNLYFALTKLLPGRLKEFLTEITTRNLLKFQNATQ
jgi:uncharacterized protein